MPGGRELGAIILKLHKRGFSEADVPGQSGKCFIVTEANAGIGFEVSRVLAERGARVLLALVYEPDLTGHNRF
jgi:hypothetical protein